MRVIAGTHGGLRLDSFKGRSVRPTTDRTKELIFNVLRDVSGVSVLDVFAGTGSLGIEALSRGATRAVFVEKGCAVRDVLSRNLERTGFADRSEIFTATASIAFRELTRRDEKFDLILADPPYHRASAVDAVNLVVGHDILHPKGRLVVESSSRSEPVVSLGSMILSDTKTAGDSRISFFVYEG